MQIVLVYLQGQRRKGLTGTFICGLTPVTVIKPRAWHVRMPGTEHFTLSQRPWEAGTACIPILQVRKRVTQVT